MFEKLRFFVGFHLSVQLYRWNRDHNKNEYLDQKIRYFYICKEVPSFVQITKMGVKNSSDNPYTTHAELYFEDGEYFPLFSFSLAKLENYRVNISPNFIFTMHGLNVDINLDEVGKDIDLEKFFIRLAQAGYVELYTDEYPEDFLVKEISQYLVDKNGT